MKYYSYENFKQDTNELIKQVREYNPDSIVAIARGGLSIAHVMAEGLNIRDVQSLRTELYDDTNKRDSITIFNNCEFKGVKKVLVVDDIADSGDTFKAVMKSLKAKNSEIEFKSVALFYKKSSIYEPHFWINETKEWIEFFWERDFIQSE